MTSIYPVNRDGDTAEIPVVPPPVHPGAPSWQQEPYESEPVRRMPWSSGESRELEKSSSVRRCSPLTRRRAFTTCIGFVFISLVLFLGARWGGNLGLSYGASRLAWQLPLAGCLTLVLPALIRMRIPMAWSLPLVLAAGSCWTAWVAWDHAGEPVPNTCGALGELIGTCDFTVYPWWLAVLFMSVLTLKCLLLAWSVYEDSITVIEVDRSHTR